MKRIEDLDLNNKKVIIRVDYNVPLNNNLEITILTENISKEKNNLKTELNNLNNLNRELRDLENINNNNTNKELETLLNTYYAAVNNKDNLESTIESLMRKKDSINNSIIELENLNKNSHSHINQREKELQERELRLNTLNIKMDNLFLFSIIIFSFNNFRLSTC